ncbi:MAG: nitroreductase family protein [Paludibacteraceae bacterium]|nr:nitroreductase family protein [Paludibacteraceae bacterium]
MDNFLELLQHRRSIRKYTAQPVEEEKIECLTRAALMSPAGKRLNPWQFVVVTDHEKLSKMSQCRTYGSQMLNEAPLGIVVCADASLSDTWQFDCAITAENIMLAARDMGLGSCWVQVYGREHDDPEGRFNTAEQWVRHLLSIPDNITVVCVVSIGYPNEERKPYDFDKLPYDKIHRETW